MSDPPEGIQVEGFKAARGGVEVSSRADAGKVKPGLKGNLIVDVFILRQPPAQEGKPPRPARRVPFGSLPAVPFEVVSQ